MIGDVRQRLSIQRLRKRMGTGSSDCEQQAMSSAAFRFALQSRHRGCSRAEAASKVRSVDELEEADMNLKAFLRQRLTALPA